MRGTVRTFFMLGPFDSERHSVSPVPKMNRWINRLLDRGDNNVERGAHLCLLVQCHHEERFPLVFATNSPFVPAPSLRRG